MTEKLKTLMDEVTALVGPDLAAPDLDAIVTAGDRAVRRRRAAVAVAGLATAAVTAAGAVLVAGTGPTGGEDPDVAATVDGAALSWALGTEIHTPAGTVDTRHPVRAYVRTAVGYVSVDGRGTVYSVVSGAVQEVGQVEASSLYLAADDETGLAAWLERHPDGWRWVVLDQETGRRVSETAAGTGREVPGVVKAVDAGRLVVSAGGYRVIDTRTGESAVLDRPDGAQELLDYEDGVSVWISRPTGEERESSYLVHRQGASTVSIPGVRGSSAALSPDGRWVAFDADEPRVHDAVSGEQTAVDIDARVFGAGYEWLDSGTVALIASRAEVGPVELLACAVPAGTCTVVAPDLGTFDEVLADGFALPTGTAVDD